MNQKPFVVVLVALTLTASLAFLVSQGWSTAPTETAALEAPPPQAATPEPAPPPAEPALKTETLEIRKRDTLVAALLRHGVSTAHAHQIAAALSAAGANLRQVRVGDQMQLSRDAAGRLLKLAYAPTAWVRFDVTEGDTGWKADRSAVDPEVRIEVRQADLQRSLWDAVESGAVAPSVLLELVQIFESEFDFTADTRAGDKFRLLVETRYAQGVPVDHGRILAAQYVSDGKLMTGVGFGSSDRFAYYDPEGRSLRKMFLRSPLQFSRISSGFTYRRPHPILGGVRPHLAIDYVAPVGTPVWAVADAVVEFAGRKGGNGIQVVLRHRAGYETYYNHLSRVAAGVRSGVRVGQKQVIGYVGSTGLSTGPHLDYRVSHGGTFVNPLGEKFLPGEPIANAQRATYLEHARALVTRLEQEAPFQL